MIAREIQEGIEAADRGEFATDEEMREFFIECGVNVRD
jgi:predicted transcriptional regulator